jgi:hypothetical protein
VYVVVMTTSIHCPPASEKWHRDPVVRARRGNA